MYINAIRQVRRLLIVLLVSYKRIRIILYSITGLINLAIMKQAVLLLPYMIIGLSMGILLSKKISEKLVKRSVVILLILTGISLIINNLR